MNKDIFKIKKKNFTFNFISCNKVLEHLENPVVFLRSFRKFCKTNTIVYLEVPSNKSLIKGKNALELALEHFHIFSLASFNNMIKKAGFKVLKISNITDPSGKKTLFAFCK